MSEDTKLARRKDWVGTGICSYDDSLAADDEALVQPPRRQRKHVVEDIGLARIVLEQTIVQKSRHAKVQRVSDVAADAERGHVLPLAAVRACAGCVVLRIEVHPLPAVYGNAFEG